MWTDMLFQNWSGIVRTVIVGALAYAALIAVLRTSGKRTLSKMNAFDLVVTVALGSILATILLSESVALAEGVVAFSTLIGLQFVISWLTVRSTLASQLVKSEPALVLYDGRLLPEQMRRERVTEDEVRAALRAQGMGSLADVAGVVLETDGSFTVVPRSGRGQDSTLAGVQGMPDARGSVPVGASRQRHG